MRRDEGKLKYHIILLILSAFYILGLFNIFYFIYTYYVNSQKILILPQKPFDSKVDKVRIYI